MYVSHIEINFQSFFFLPILDWYYFGSFRRRSNQIFMVSFHDLIKGSYMFFHALRFAGSGEFVLTQGC